MTGNVWSRVCALSLVLLLHGCGGGGDSGDAAPPPQRGGGGTTPPPAASPATPATLDRSTTRELAATTIAELGLADTGTERAYLPRIVARGRAVLANLENPCPGGGSVDEKQNLDEDLTGTLDITFNDCVEGGARQSGTLHARIDEFDREQNAATAYELEFRDLTFAVGDRSLAAQGRAAVSEEAGVEKTNYRLAGRYLPEDLSTGLEDLTVEENVASSGMRRVTLTGRLKHSVHGYVELSTLEELVFANAAAREPSSGVIRLIGARDATADITFTGRRVHIMLDADGNGRVDAGLATTWRELMDVRNFAPAANAGADLTVEKGKNVTADASASADWEGDPLTYQWALTSKPSGSAVTVSGTSPTVTFKPDVVGAYDLQVTVRDGQGSSNDAVRVTVLPGGEPPPNRKPVANAGLDQITVERQMVTIDGSQTLDPDNDPLLYAWAMVRAPTGTAVSVAATTATFEFVPDLPGIYELRLTASDGRSSDTDSVRIIADRLIAFAGDAHFRIKGKSLKGDDTGTLALRTSAHHRGAPVRVAATSDRNWLIVTTPSVSTAVPGEATGVGLQLNLDVVKTLRNGLHRATVTAVPEGGQRPAVAEVTLNLRIPRVDKIAPYVAYSGSASSVTLYGEAMDEADGSSLIVNGVEVLGITASGEERARVQLPPLPAGTYTVRIADALGLGLDSGRVLVRDPPVYSDAQLSLPGALVSASYDPERDALYGVFRAADGGSLAGRLQHSAGGWQLDTIPIAAPDAVGLSADGAQLFVSAANCTVHRLDPATLAILESLTKASCDPLLEVFGVIAGLADGRVLLIDDELNSNIYEYPSFAPAALVPGIRYPVAVVNYERNRLLWAPSEPGVEPRPVWYHDIGASAQGASLAGSQVSAARLAVSGDGSRTLHQARVYDRSLTLIGTLGGRFPDADLMTAVDRSARRAVALDLDSNELTVHDLSGPGPVFPQVGSAVSLLSNVVEGSRVLIAPNGAAAFIFTVNQWLPGFDPDPFKLYVRLLP